MADRTRNPDILTAERVAEQLPRFWQALDEFNQGLFFKAHETLEDLWLVTPSPQRELFRGIIQMAAAFVHFARGEHAGTLGLLDAALARLRPFAPQALGVDVTSLVSDLERTRGEMGLLGPAGFTGIDRARLPRVRYSKETQDG